MTNRTALALLFLLPLTIGPCAAEMATGAPRFSAEEEIVISRNAALHDLLTRDRWLLRRVMDAMSQTRAAASASRSAGEPPEIPPDPDRNPDLDEFGRASPEAAHDLFQLIKKATQKPRTGEH